MYHVLFMPTVLKLLRRTCPGCCALRPAKASACAACGHPTPKLKGRVHTVHEEYTYAQRAAWSDALPLKAAVPASEARRRLKGLSDADVARAGLCAGRPEHLLCTVVPVCPPQARPTVQQSSGRCSVDDVTHKYAEILRANDALKERLLGMRPQHVIDDGLRALQWHVSTLLDSQIPTSRKDFDYGRLEARQGLRQRLEGKQGRFRSNLMGTLATSDHNNTRTL